MNEYKLTIIQKIESMFREVMNDVVTTCDVNISSMDKEYAHEHASELMEQIGIQLRILAQPLDLRVKRRGKHIANPTLDKP